MSRGLSKDAKRLRIISLLHDTKEPYALPELEVLAAKAGVVRQSVKDIVTECASDGDILTDRLGTTVFYWSFPSQIGHSKNTKLAELKGRIKRAHSTMEELQTRQTNAETSRKPSEERAAKMQKFRELEKETADLKAELVTLTGNDPAVIEAMAEDAQVALDAANRWTDNIFNMRTWASQKLNVQRSDFDKNFGIPGDFDYLEPEQ